MTKVSGKEYKTKNMGLLLDLEKMRLEFLKNGDFMRFIALSYTALSYNG